MTPTPDTSPVAVKAMIERLLAGDLCTVELAPEAAAMLREVARERDETRAAINRQSSAIRSLRANEESEINILRSRSRDHYIATVTLDSERDANARLTDALLAAEAEAAALREALGSVMPFIATQSIGCHGEKCREPWCHSCWDEDDAEEAAMVGLVAKRRAEAALAANREG